LAALAVMAVAVAEQTPTSAAALLAPAVKAQSFCIGQKAIKQK
jgi:hypothetical protein